MKNQRGDISVMIAGAIILMGLIGLLATFTSSKKASQIQNQSGSAREQVALQLEALIGQLPTSPDLDAAPEKNPHSNGNLKWTVTDINSPGVARLKKIVVTANLVNSNSKVMDTKNQISITGYRYDDF